MQIYCLKNKNCSETVIDTLNTILNHSGFFFCWIDAISEADKSSLIIEYAPLRKSPSVSEKHLYIPVLKQPDLLKKQDNWMEVTLDSGSVPVVQGTVLQQAPDNYFEIDIIANVFYHLNRVEESDYTHPDQIDPEGSHSVFNKYGNFQLPIVDLLTDHFANWLTQKAQDLRTPLIRKAAFPQAQPFGLALTHDVDFIRAYQPLKKLFLKLKSLVGFSGNLSRTDIDKADNDQWGFDRLLPFYQQKGWQTTFFFLAKYFEGWHLRYRIGSRKMKRLLHLLAEQKHEIGFHPSRYSFEHPGRYLKEKRKLEKTAGVKLAGMRHHYLRGLFPGLWQTAAQLDLKYEASLAQRRKSGLRAGTWRPYFSFGTESAVLVISTAFFENTLPDEGKNPDASLTEIKRLIDTIKIHNGLLTALWHTNNLHHPANYEAIWQGFIKLVEQENPFIARLDEHTKWITLRNQIQINAVAQAGEKTVLTISFPYDLTEFTLLLPAEINNININDETIEYRQVGSQLYIQNPSGLEQLTLIFDAA